MKAPHTVSKDRVDRHSSWPGLQHRIRVSNTTVCLMALVNTVISMSYPSLPSIMPILIKQKNWASLANKSLHQNSPSIIWSTAKALSSSCPNWGLWWPKPSITRSAAMVLASVTISNKLRQRSPTSSNPFTHLIKSGIRTSHLTLLRTTSSSIGDLITSGHHKYVAHQFASLLDSASQLTLSIQRVRTQSPIRNSRPRQGGRIARTPREDG